MKIECDVCVIGGGPAGSTVGSVLKKYNPNLKVVILEREKFPRDHVGESQLPLISRVLDEIGVWEKVEKAGFPIKIGATYRWGRTEELWDFEFIPDGKFEGGRRPGKYAGQRLSTAFQVDRAIYDKILLDHAADLGCHVLQETGVREVLRTGDRVDALTLSNEDRVVARHYVDASGHSGILRRAMGIEVETPSHLQHIAIWSYWKNAEWAVSVGVGGTRVQVLSQPHGWIWFIPLGPTRTSVGLIVPAKFYKEQAKRPDELYHSALEADPVLQNLMRNATVDGEVHTTKDWSFVSERLAGENWFLAGESAGFADPILAAGMTLAHTGGRNVAYTIMALDRGDFEPDWLRNHYCATHRAQIRQHIRFADFWYTANGVFSDLEEHAKDIAYDAGLSLSAKEAWRWLGQGGFIEPNGSTDVGFYSTRITKELLSSFSGDRRFYEIEGKTHFRADLAGAEKDWVAIMANGTITRFRSYRREGKTLPLVGPMGWLVRYLSAERSFPELKAATDAHGVEKAMPPEEFYLFWTECAKALETLVTYGWVIAREEPGAPGYPPFDYDLSSVLHQNRDPKLEPDSAPGIESRRAG